MSAHGPKRGGDAASDRRTCDGCGATLARDNTGHRCSRCLRDQRDQLRTPPAHLPEDFWETEDFRAAFRARHIGRVFKAYRNHPRHRQIFGKALNQATLGRWLRLEQSQVSKIENAPEPELNTKVIEGYAETLHIPRHLLWIVPEGHTLSTYQSKLAQAGSAPFGFNVETTLDEIEGLAAEILGSSTADGAISQLAKATVSLAESHTQAPARQVLTQVLQLHKQARMLLGGRQRLSQKRELFRIESDLLAHACILLDDLKQNEVAQKYGDIALSFAQEAGIGQATARTALAKALRWAERLIESADMAKIGYECSPATSVRIQLASQEANAAALMGNAKRAREALSRADVAAETVPADSGTSAWSFSTGRRAIFTLSVALATGDPDTALRAVTMADNSWASGAPSIPANWAQIRIGAGIAHLSKGSLEAAIGEVAPVLDMAPELRISTVTAYIDRLDRKLGHSRFKGDNDVADFRQRIQYFKSTALSSES
jgi:hypothetical protein